MSSELSLNETRVIACLIEKEITTPEQYPLSLNALTNACNQKSNRSPVLGLSDIEVQQTLDALAKKHLVADKVGFGSRVTKYHHRFCNTEFGTLKFTEQELGVVCELFLRGPQTPGELRSHTQRLCRFSDVHEVEVTLSGLAEREDGPFVVRMPREPGRRESRYAHLFSGEVEAAPAEAPPSVAAPPAANDRLEALEGEVAQLREELDELRTLLDELTS